jgi:hypothetical protein
MQKGTLISDNVRFSALLPTTPIILPNSGPQCKKVIRNVARIAEKLSALLATTQKNVRIRISPRIETIYKFTVGFQSEASADVFHEEKLK